MNITTKKLSVLIGVLLSTAISLKAQFSFVPCNGYNADIVANGVGAASGSSTAAMDGAGNVFVAADFNPGSGICAAGVTALPLSNIVTSTNTANNTGIAYILESYAANNALRLPTATPTGTLTVTTPISASVIYLLALSGDGAGVMNVTVNFTDATSETISNMNVPDWCINSGTANFGLNGQIYYRIGQTAVTCTGSTCQYLNEIPVSISSSNWTKAIASITVTRVSGGIVAVMGVGRKAACAIPANQATNLLVGTTTTSSIAASFTAAASAPNGYLVVAYPIGSITTNPTNGITYTTGQPLGNGIVVQSSAATSFNAGGLSGNTAYDFYIYSYNTATNCGGPMYNTSTPLTASFATNSCGTLSGIIPVGATAPASPAGFSNLTTAIAYITANGLGGATILELQTDYDPSTETYPIIFPYNACVGATLPLTVRPASSVVSAFTLTSASALATVDFNGCKYVTIDGRPGGIGNQKMISIVNSNTSAFSTVRFINDASNNILRNCDIQGASTLAANPTTCGVVYFAGTTGNFGNDNNTVSFCNIHSVGANLPSVGVGAYNSTTPGSVANNDNNSISNCNIYDFFIATNTSTGIKIDGGNNSYSITNNHLYQTAARTMTTVSVFRFLWLNSNGTGINVNYGSGHIVSGNYFGGSNALGTGTTSITAANTSTFMGMDISVGNGAATQITNDTITNISFQSSNITTTGTGQFSAISVNYGNVATISNNIVGKHNGGIDVNSTGALANILVCGIRVGGGILPVNVSNNRVGKISTNNSNVGFAHQLVGITFNAGTMQPTITNNKVDNFFVGSGTTTATGATQAVGILLSVGSLNPIITNNEIVNLFNYAPTGNLSVVGININSTAITTSITIAGNKIYNLTNNAVSSSTTFAPTVQGISINAGAAATVLVDKNFIHSFSQPNWTPSGAATSTPIFAGINTVSGSTYQIYNNMIRLGIDNDGNDVTQPISFRGIFRNSGAGTYYVYHNSVYIGGAGVGQSSAATSSAAFFRAASATLDDLRNNILVNVRSNASTGMKNYVVYLGSFLAFTVNGNNYYNAPSSTNLFAFNGSADVTNYAPNWMTGDINSITSNPNFVNATGDFSAVDLHINMSTPSPIDQAGVAGLNNPPSNDFDGDLRSAFTPIDMGADAVTMLGALSNSPVCSATNIQLNVYPNAADAYAWSGPNGFSSAIQAPTINNATSINAGVYTATVTVSGVPTTYTVNVIVNSSPSVSINASSTTICSGNSISLSQSGLTNYVWSTGATTAALNVTPSVSQTYSISGTNANGCTGTASVAITVNTSPVVSITASSTTVCSGSFVTLTQAGLSDYIWTTGDVNTNPIVFQPSSSFQCFVAGSDANGCPGNASVQLTVISVQVAANASSNAVCEGNSVILYQTGFDTFQWDNGFGTDSVFTDTPLATQLYTINGTTAAGCAASASIGVTVNPIPVVNIDFAAFDTLCFNSVVSLSGESPIGGTYSGTNVNGNTFTANNVGTNTITYTYTDANTCSNSISGDIEVDLCTEIVANKDILDWLIYPNPTADNIFITFNNTNVKGNVKLEMRDITGRLVKNININNANVSINCNDLSNGLYSIHLLVDGVQQNVKRVVIEH